MTRSEAREKFEKATVDYGWPGYTVDDRRVLLSKSNDTDPEFNQPYLVLVENAKNDQGAIVEIPSELYRLIRGAAANIACEHTPEGHGVGSSDVNCYIDEVCWGLFCERAN